MSDTLTRDLLDGALRLTRAGWRVFPVVPGGKRPLLPRAHKPGVVCHGECGRDGHGVYDATTDHDRITAWWWRFPSANVGLACGAPGPDVVDIDVKGVADGRASYARLRDAGLLRGAHSVVTTPSGGWHLYFAGTEQGNAVRAVHGIDFRGRGGYVLAPPSFVLDAEKGYEGAYRLAEYRDTNTGLRVDWDAIRRFLDPPRSGARRSAMARPKGDDCTALVAWVAAQQEGNRNAGLYWAARTALETGASDDVLDTLRDAAISTGLTLSEATATVASAAPLWRSA